LGGLGGGELVDTLIDDAFISGFGIEGLSESDLGFAQTAIGRLAFGLVVLEDGANALALFGCQPKLIDGVFDWRKRGFLRVCDIDREEDGEEKCKGSECHFGLKHSY
jgi:hypothetical protein